MAEKRVSVRLAAVGGRQVRAEMEGVGEAGSRGFGRLSREMASFVRSIWSASCSETTTPKASTSSVAWRSVAVSIRLMAMEPSSPKS